MTTPELIAALNEVMRALGYRTTFSPLRGGWVAEKHNETGNVFKVRTTQLADILRRRQEQLARYMTRARAREPQP